MIEFSGISSFSLKTFNYIYSNIYLKRSVKLCSPTDEMIKAGMKELDTDGIAEALHQIIQSANANVVDKECESISFCFY